jgi:hypothetical protein
MTCSPRRFGRDSLVTPQQIEIGAIKIVDPFLVGPEIDHDRKLFSGLPIRITVRTDDCSELSGCFNPVSR